MKDNRLQLEKFTFPQLLRAICETYGDDHTAYIADDISVSCRELRERVGSMALLFINEYGIKPGDRVSLAGGNSVDWLICFFTVIRAGGMRRNA